jgi:hypothetical protein
MTPTASAAVVRAMHIFRRNGCFDVGRMPGISRVAVLAISVVLATATGVAQHLTFRAKV